MSTNIRPTPARFASLLLGIAAVLALAACSDESGAPAAAGAANGGAGSGAAGAGSGSGGLGGGGTSAGSGAIGGAGMGGGGAATAGLGGQNAGSGGAGSGGMTAGNGGAGGGMSAGSGGAGGGMSAGSGGAGNGGASAGNAGAAGSAGAGSGPVFHLFMLMGQSNMAGVATRQASDSNSDQRLKVLGGCNQPAGQWNLANPPLSDCPGERGWNLSDSVDPGIWFGKTLLARLPAGDTIGLVATAESGESIDTFISGGSHHQMILNKIAIAKTAPNARFAGVIFHQGESDNTQSSWPGKVVQLYNEVKAAFGVGFDVPFILGELPQGGCCAAHNTRVHEAADLLPRGDWVSQEGTSVMDQYHFDHDSVVLMGRRYGEAMIEALGW